MIEKLGYCPKCGSEFDQIEYDRQFCCICGWKHGNSEVKDLKKEIKECFNSIICLCVEGREVVSRKNLLDEIEKDAQNGYELCENSNYFQIGSQLLWIKAILDGKKVSDAAMSFPLVRRVFELKQNEIKIEDPAETARKSAEASLAKWKAEQEVE